MTMNNTTEPRDVPRGVTLATLTDDPTLEDPPTMTPRKRNEKTSVRKVSRKMLAVTLAMTTFMVAFAGPLVSTLARQTDRVAEIAQDTPLDGVADAVADAANGVADVVDPDASAGAYSCSRFGRQLWGAIHQGFYCGQTFGTRTHVTAVHGQFGVVGNVCNWHITAEFFDSNGRWYKTYESPKNWGCSTRGYDAIWINRYMKRGQMCTTLKSNGARVASVCHSIH